MHRHVVAGPRRGLVDRASTRLPARTRACARAPARASARPRPRPRPRFLRTCAHCDFTSIPVLVPVLVLVLVLVLVPVLVSVFVLVLVLATPPSTRPTSPLPVEPLNRNKPSERNEDDEEGELVHPVSIANPR